MLLLKLASAASDGVQRSSPAVRSLKYIDVSFFRGILFGFASKGNPNEPQLVWGSPALRHIHIAITEANQNLLKESLSRKIPNTTARILGLESSSLQSVEPKWADATLGAGLACI